MAGNNGISTTSKEGISFGKKGILETVNLSWPQ